MTDHLPECHTAMIPDFHNERWICICAALRACEQRVNSSNLTMWDRTQEQAQQMVTSGLGIAWKDGFKEGINAAREAVAGIQDGPKNQPYWIDREAALTAIDALREKP